MEKDNSKRDLKNGEGDCDTENSVAEVGGTEDGVNPNMQLAAAEKKKHEIDGWTIKIVSAGIAIFVVNIIIAWLVAYQSSQRVGRPFIAKDTETAASKALEKMSGAKPNEILLLSKLVEADVHYTVVSNKQTITIIGVAFAFGMLALGFSLSIMGIKSSLEFKGEVADRASLVIRSSAPGVVCFLLAFFLVMAAQISSSGIRFDDFNLQGQGGGAGVIGNNGNPSVPKPKVEKIKESKKNDLLREWNGKLK